MDFEQIYKDLECLNNNITALDSICELDINNVKIESSNVLKRLIRKLTCWLYKPMFDRQTTVNMHIQAALGDIYRTQSELSR